MYGRAVLSIGSANRSSHQPLARAIIRSHLHLFFQNQTDNQHELIVPLLTTNAPQPKLVVKLTL